MQDLDLRVYVGIIIIIMDVQKADIIIIVVQLYNIKRPDFPKRVLGGEPGIKIKYDLKLVTRDKVLS